MSSQFPSRSRRPRGRRALAASGMAAALVVVPGLAQAEEPAAPQPLADLLGGATGGGQARGGGSGGEVGGGAGPFPGVPAGDDGTADPGTGTDVPLELPAEFESALQQLAAALQLPQDCVDGVTRSLELVVGGLAELPAELEELAGQLQGALEAPSGGGGLDGLLGLGEQLQGVLDPATLEESSIVEGLTLLAETFPTCVPALPAAEPPTHTPEPPDVPAAASPAPPEPVAHPVVYPGYAPTGAEDDGTDLLPAALGSALALAGTGAGAAAYRRQWRAADPRR
ncbi:hypothetical protein ABC795_01985 [Blastococcus sp. HT6-30]|uniref:hypothetical protein n=1 Tax=Blastococcus sp. HT6-30 TaxID=3144843 RepID=UPI0032195252